MSLNKQEEKTVRRFAESIKESLGNNVIFLELFGSKVRGDFSSDSDIDILLVVKNKTPEVRDTIFNILFDIDPYYKFKISPIMYSEFEYQKNRELESTFVETISREGVML